MNKLLNVNCPKCKTAFNYYSSEFRPFCSERCKNVDLGHWVTESYRVPSQERLTETDLEKVIEKKNEDQEAHGQTIH